jgi:hypothetical protein
MYIFFINILIFFCLIPLILNRVDQVLIDQAGKQQAETNDSEQQNSNTYIFFINILIFFSLIPLI